MFYAYILQSLQDSRTYAGHTEDLARRLKQHNDGFVSATKYRRPLQLLFAEEFLTLEEAKKQELWWKSGAGRRVLKKFFRESSSASPQARLARSAWRPKDKTKPKDEDEEIPSSGEEESSDEDNAGADIDKSG